MASIEEIQSGVQTLLGQPTDRELPQHAIFEAITDAIAYYTAELQLSDGNFLLVKKAFNAPSSRDMQAPADDIAAPVRLERLDTAAADSNDWTDVELINHAQINDARELGLRQAALYGTNPRRLAFSWDVWDDSSRLQLWYEPDQAAPASLTESPQITSIFHTMIKLRAALNCLLISTKQPELIGARDSRFSKDLDQWERNFFIHRLQNPEQSITKKTPFNRGRR